MKDITYYAFAENLKGQIEQMFVRRDKKLGTGCGRFTGKIYESVKEAEADMRILNCAASFS